MMHGPINIRFIFIILVLRVLVGEGKAAYVAIAFSPYSGFEALDFSGSSTKTRVAHKALTMLLPSHSFLIA